MHNGEKMKYCMGVNALKQPMLDFIKEMPMKSGLYNWIRVFDGELLPYKEILDRTDEYDVIHCNMAPSDWYMIGKIAEKTKNSSTKLVLNNDHICQIWKGWNQHPQAYIEIQKKGDMIFGTEPIQTAHMIDGAKCIPHPTNTREIGLFKSKDRANSDSLGIFYHFYYDDPYLTWILMEKLNIGKFYTRLYAYNPKHDEMERWTPNLFDFVAGKYLPFRQYIFEMLSNRLMYDSCPYYVYGRTNTETACIGIPTVGSDTVYSGKICWPELVCNPLDILKKKKLI